MGQVLLAILIIVPACAAIVFILAIGDAGFERLMARFRPRCRYLPPPEQTQTAAQGVADRLVCRVRLDGQQDGNETEVFEVQIRGAIPSLNAKERVRVCICIDDITEPGKAVPVRSKAGQWQKDGSSLFIYTAELGKLPATDDVIQQWTPIARLSCDWLLFARKGPRTLRFHISIVSCQSERELAGVSCTFVYDNPCFGYLDLQENISRANTLAVALAFAVSAADREMSDCEIEVIRQWAQRHIDIFKASQTARRSLEKALEKTIKFFQKGKRIDIRRLCKDIVEIVPVAERYDILELCLRVAQAGGRASAQEVSLVKDIAGWLHVSRDRFRSMMEKLLPASIYETEDIEAALGIGPEMDAEQIRQHLNKEYRKWNARVTSSDPQVQAQADYMLKFIARARKEYVV